MSRLQQFFLLLFILACPVCVSGQALSTLIPLNKNAIEGKLPNGLRYVIHKNPNPKGKIEFRMVLNVGSVLEDTHQKGMSHFIEHMVFNGAKDFPDNKATRLLQAMGIKYGYDLNAFTDNDKTIYILPAPIDKKENIDTALNILYNWLTSLNLHTSDIEKEKKIVTQEIKDATVHDIFYTTKVHNSRYGDRPVLGSEESIQSFDSISVRSYYDKWYRPDLATIIAVGDLDINEIRTKINNVFSKAISRTNEFPIRTIYSLPTEGESIIQQEQDTLLSSNKLDIIFPEKIYPIATYLDLRNNLLDQLFKKMLSERIAGDKSLKCQYTKAWYLSDISHHSFEISALSDTAMYRSVQRTSQLLAQIKQHGFTSVELETAKTEFLKNQSKEDFARTSESYCSDYVDLAVTGDRYIGNKAKYDFYKSIIDSVSIHDFTNMINLFFDANRQVYLCYLYNPMLSSTLDKNSILEYWNKGLTSEMTEYLFTDKVKNNNETESKVNIELDVKDLPDVHVITEKVYENIGVTELMLSNGIKAAFKPIVNSDNKNIMITLVGRGGFSILPIDKYPYYSGTAAYVDMSGVGTLSADTLNDLCYQKEIALSTNIDNYYHEMYGIAFEGNIDDLLKLFYLKITDLNKNKVDFDSDIESQISSLGKDDLLLKQINRDPNRILQNMTARYSGYIHKGSKYLTTKEDILKIKLEDNISFFKQLFNNGKLTAIITGAFDIDSIKPKVVQYLGALPNRKINLQMADVGDHFPHDIKNKIINDTNASRANITTLIYGQYQQSLKESIIFKIMRDIISNRMLASLREKEGLVYSPYVNITYRAYPKAEFCFNVNYYCDKEYISFLEKLLWSNLDILKNELISESELNNIKQSFLISKRENLSESNTAEWRNKLKEMYLENKSISDFANYDSILFHISAEDIKESFQKYIDHKQFMTISIMNQSDN